MSGEIYRLKMKLGHWLGWHFMPIVGPLMSGNGYQRWCKWCGLRHCFDEHPLSENVKQEYAQKGWRRIGNWLKKK